ncbi:hypothetical protein [Embleya sp. NPDC020630]|uniref:hypothetical protein n=1 Tax=Embleya sp. NPDC020630 TaxID=3363979 RepID=UPI003797F9E7
MIQRLAQAVAAATTVHPLRLAGEAAAPGTLGGGPLELALGPCSVRHTLDAAGIG